VVLVACYSSFGYVFFLFSKLVHGSYYLFQFYVSMVAKEMLEVLQIYHRILINIKHAIVELTGMIIHYL
jgi:hypothetical protein